MPILEFHVPCPFCGKEVGKDSLTDSWEMPQVGVPAWRHVCFPELVKEKEE